jgi:hypothetical protein
MVVHGIISVDGYVCVPVLMGFFGLGRGIGSDLAALGGIITTAPC